jgi:hypothetical protein
LAVSVAGDERFPLRGGNRRCRAAEVEDFGTGRLLAGHADELALDIDERGGTVLISSCA